jgi:ADP-ribosylglycohydrolase
MSIRILNENEYYRTVYGGWLGKNIGGTLGAPVEGKKELLHLDYYPVLPDGPLENDDLDLQLVWLHALEQYGPKLTSKELGQEWVEHIFFPFDEYGYALANLRRGLEPPIAGGFNNPFIDCMGAPIRSEIWAMVSPGAPHIAAHFAYQDAIVDHAGGEGVYGEMFFAAIESAIFMEKDRDKLIAIGMSYIPPSCRTAKALVDLLRWHDEGKNWLEARELILEHHGHDNFTDAPQNIAFTILGWLYGNNFEDAILKAVNCGYDTDCTAATLGAILGMIVGPEGLPEKWVKPVGDRVVISPPIKGFPAPSNLDELTKRTIRIGKQVLAIWDTEIVVHPGLPTDYGVKTLELKEPLNELWNSNVLVDRRLLPNNTIEALSLVLEVDYGKNGPSIARNQRKQLTLTITNRSTEEWQGNLALELPKGWEGTKEQLFRIQAGNSSSFIFDVCSISMATSTYELAAVVTRIHDNSIWSQWKEPIRLVSASEWTIWGPDDEKGVHAVFQGNRIEWEIALNTELNGVYRAQTLLCNPSERKVKLIVASNGLVSAKLNGNTVINCIEIEEFMPAFHRAPESQWVEMTLPAGSHELEIVAHRKNAPLSVYVLPVALNKTEQPGPCYYYTDILLGN